MLPCTGCGCVRVGTHLDGDVALGYLPHVEPDCRDHVLVELTALHRRGRGEGLEWEELEGKGLEGEELEGGGLEGEELERKELKWEEMEEKYLEGGGVGEGGVDIHIYIIVYCM